MAKKTLNLEEAFKRLEEIVTILESGGKDLEKSIKLFEEGMQISNQCQQQLQALEKRVKVLVEKESGEFTVTDFEQKV